MIMAAEKGYLDLANRLQRMQIRYGFQLTYSHGSMYFPVDIIEMIADFAVLK